MPKMNTANQRVLIFPRIFHHKPISPPTNMEMCPGGGLSIKAWETIRRQSSEGSLSKLKPAS